MLIFLFIIGIFAIPFLLKKPLLALFPLGLLVLGTLALFISVGESVLFLLGFTALIGAVGGIIGLVVHRSYNNRRQKITAFAALFIVFIPLLLGIEMGTGATRRPLVLWEAHRYIARHHPQLDMTIRHESFHHAFQSFTLHAQDRNDPTITLRIQREGRNICSR